MMRRAFFIVFLYALALYVWTAPKSARAIERNLAGSAQIDYHTVVANLRANRNAGVSDVIDGFTLEAAMKVAVDVSDHLSANVKLCYGCHGFEADMAYVDLRASDELNLRVGRFSPSFGAFNLRHDTANHKLSDKPLPYDMGRMLRAGAWNNGVLPSPFPDNGVEVNGTHWFGEKVQFDYALYAVSGFKETGANPRPYDLNFGLSHAPFYIDNNSRPSFGSRIAFTAKLSALSDVTAGASAMGGTYDVANSFNYVIVGGDAAIRIERTSIRLEYLLRRQTFDVSTPTFFKYGIAPNHGNVFAKHGAFFEIEQPLSRAVDAIARLDGMYRTGNVLATSELSDGSWVARGTLGATLTVERNLKFKGSVEFWRFNDPDGAGGRSEQSFHLGAAGSF